MSLLQFLRNRTAAQTNQIQFGELAATVGTMVATVATVAVPAAGLPVVAAVVGAVAAVVMTTGMVEALVTVAVATAAMEMEAVT
jgi:hypothetical protein